MADSFVARTGEPTLVDGGTFVRIQQPQGNIWAPGGIYDSVANRTLLSDRKIIGVGILSYQGSAVEGLDFGIAYDADGDKVWFGAGISNAEAKVFFGPRPQAGSTDDPNGDQVDDQDVADALADSGDYTRDDGTLAGDTPRHLYPPAAEAQAPRSPLKGFALLAGGGLAAFFGIRALVRALKGKRRRRR